MIVIHSFVEFFLYLNNNSFKINFLWKPTEGNFWFSGAFLVGIHFTEAESGEAALFDMLFNEYFRLE